MKLQNLKIGVFVSTIIMTFGITVNAQFTGCSGTNCGNGRYTNGSIDLYNPGSNTICGTCSGNLLGATNSTVSNNADGSIIIGEGNEINDGNNNIAIGKDNTIGPNIGPDEAGAFGNSNIVDGNIAFAFGRQIFIDKDFSYGMGELIDITGERSIAIGFGNLSSATALDDLGNKSITLGVEANNVFNITLNGNGIPVTGIGTGTSTPGSKLQIVGNGTSSSTSALDVQDNGNNSLLFVRDDGNVGIGTNSPSNNLSVEGIIAPATDNTYDLGTSNKHFVDIYHTGNIIGGSDRRIKKNIMEFNYGLDEIMKLRPISYKLKGHNNRSTDLGLIAQEVDGVINEVVKTGENGMMGIAYPRLIPVLINGIQEQQKQIKEKDQKITSLQQQVNRQNEKIGNMQKRLAKLEKAVYDKQEKRQSDSEKSNTSLHERARLGQNVPNPFNQTTTIDYYLPESVSNARLVIANTNGHVVKEFSLKQPGKGDVQVEGGTLKPGTYPYYLLIDGQRVADRKLTILGR